MFTLDLKIDQGDKHLYKFPRYNCQNLKNKIGFGPAVSLNRRMTGINFGDQSLEKSN